ncbi:uncharacterized protein LOC129318254 isoform X3 [Prosopis cineraria]|uniref:uncharacterized protein LOC129318254 isoform X3 n=1 Tax=Prosopis cineraria TaxID=364024 RepID=UPI0024107869|nr:uncharacterized protein LOC129318254 isoform X3 [Prosopis cineraria]
MATSNELACVSTSTNLTIPPWKYHVFLSFRGEDTRRDFTAELHNALKERCIRTFIDYDIRKGKDISPELIQAIEESLCAIIIFSKDYAASTWCLDELSKIVDCKKAWSRFVFPVFYNIDPSDVRHQRGTFAAAFQQHCEIFTQEQVQKWRNDLKEVANISGYHWIDGNKENNIRKIVTGVWGQISQIPFVLRKLKHEEVIKGVGHPQAINFLFDLDLSGKSLPFMDFSYAGFKDVRMVQTNLDCTKFLDVNVEECIFDCSNFPRCQFNRATFRRVSLNNAALQNSTLEDACLIKCSLVGAVLTSAILKNAVLSDVNLEGAILKGANLEGAKLYNPNLKAANLEGANLPYVNLSDMDLRDVNFNFACLEHVSFLRANLLCGKFRHVNAKGSIFDFANLRRCEFNKANLHGASLKFAILEHANLNGADQSNTICTSKVET